MLLDSHRRASTQVGSVLKGVEEMYACGLLRLQKTNSNLHHVKKCVPEGRFETDLDWTLTLTYREERQRSQSMINLCRHIEKQGRGHS